MNYYYYYYYYYIARYLPQLICLWSTVCQKLQWWREAVKLFSSSSKCRTWQRELAAGELWWHFSLSSYTSVNLCIIDKNPGGIHRASPIPEGCLFSQLKCANVRLEVTQIYLVDEAHAVVQHLNHTIGTEYYFIFKRNSVVRMALDGLSFFLGLPLHSFFQVTYSNDSPISPFLNWFSFLEVQWNIKGNIHFENKLYFKVKDSFSDCHWIMYQQWHGNRDDKTVTVHCFTIQRIDDNTLKL